MRSRVVLVVVLGGCGPSVGDDAGSGSGGSGDSGAGTSTGEGATGTSAGPGTGAGPGTTEIGSGDGGSTAVEGSSSGMPVDCEALGPDECGAYPECETVSGTEATATDVPGVYSCSDLSLPFGCATAGCEVVEALVCKVDEPEVVRWVIGDCVPGGWEICDAVCG